MFMPVVLCRSSISGIETWQRECEIDSVKEIPSKKNNGGENLDERVKEE